MPGIIGSTALPPVHQSSLQSPFIGSYITLSIHKTVITGLVNPANKKRIITVSNATGPYRTATGSYYQYLGGAPT